MNDNGKRGREEEVDSQLPDEQQGASSSAVQVEDGPPTTDTINQSDPNPSSPSLQSDNQINPNKSVNPFKPTLHPNPDSGCPLCQTSSSSSSTSSPSTTPTANHVHYTLESWIGCSKCKIWFHTSCTKTDPEDFIKWYCLRCIQSSERSAQAQLSSPVIQGRGFKKPKPLSNVLKPAPRKSGRKREKIDYQRIQEGLPPDPIGRWKHIFQQRSFGKDSFRRMMPNEWTSDWLLNDPKAMEEPVMIPSEERRERERLEREQERREAKSKVPEKVIKRKGKEKWYQHSEDEEEVDKEGKSSLETEQAGEGKALIVAEEPMAASLTTNSASSIASTSTQPLDPPPALKEERTLENSIAATAQTVSQPSNQQNSIHRPSSSYSYQEFASTLASAALHSASNSTSNHSAPKSFHQQILPPPQIQNRGLHPLLQPYLYPSQHSQWIQPQAPQHFRQPQLPQLSAQQLQQQYQNQGPIPTLPLSLPPLPRPTPPQNQQQSIALTPPVHVPPTFEQLEALSSAILPLDPSKAHPPSSLSADVIRERPLTPRKMPIPGMIMPPKDMSIREIAVLVGESTPVEVVDVETQSSSKNWTLGSWATYFTTPSHMKRKILNVISLEVSSTPMEYLVEAPDLVRSLCWVTRDWPAHKRDSESKVNSWPKVQRYCLMGVKGAYTDFHIDFCAR